MDYIQHQKLSLVLNKFHIFMKIEYPKKHLWQPLDQMYDGGEEFRKELGDNGIKHVKDNYNFDSFCKKWTDLMLKIHEEEGSWETRKGLSNIVFKEVA